MVAKIYAPAEARLIGIWDYTLEKWGEEKADAYLRRLIAHIQVLHNQRHHWRPVPDPLLRGLWFVRHEHHDVFFRELTGDGIGVITVLHEKMDLPARLKEDRLQAEDP